MRKTELKDRTDELEHLPTIPAVAEGLIAALSDLPRDDGRIRMLVGEDQSLSAQVLRMANSAARQPESPVASIEDACGLVGLGGIRAAALGTGVACLTAGDGLDQSLLLGLWRHSYASALWAKRLAPYVGELACGDAYAAGLLHDVGRMALVALLPGTYSELIRSARADGLPVERVERRELGLDHALVGKWLCDRWRLPRHLTQAVWFHHLPSGTLGSRRYAVRLVEAVSLANALSHWTVDGYDDRHHAVVDAHKSAQAIGISGAALAALRGEISARVQERCAALKITGEDASDSLGVLQRATSRLVLTSAPGKDDSGVLRRSVRRLQALHDLNVSVRPGQTVEDVLGRIVIAVRTGLDVAPGMCCVFDCENNVLAGRTWESLDDPPQQFRVGLEPLGGTDDDGSDAIAMEALRQLGLGMTDTGWAGASLRSITSHGEVTAVPMLAEGVCCGQLLFDAAASNITLDDAEKSQLLAFAGACGVALTRQRTYEELNELSEELAAALQSEEKVAAEPSAGTTTRADELAAVAAQALHGPLSIVRKQVRKLAERVSDGTDIRVLDSIIEQSDRLERVVADLMAFARPGPPARYPVSVDYILHGLVLNLHSRLEDKGVAIIEEYAQGLPRLMLDRHQMEHALLNLIENAEQAMAESGGVLTLRTSASPDGRQVLIDVSDTGPGIPAEMAEEIFEPFHSAKQGARVTGLGLTVCRAIVENHSGRVWLLPTPEEGATFRVALNSVAEARPAPEPFPEPEPSHESAPEPSPEPMREMADEPVEAVHDAPRAPRVLLVDENEAVREVLRETLLNRGYSVETATDSHGAKAALTGSRFDLVLLDFQSSKEDAYGVLNELHDVYAAIPVIVMTTSVRQDEVDDVLSRGACACLLKPFGLGSLLAEVEHVMSNRNN